ncbi:MAG: SprT-like family protein [Tenericutes bacterium ADurb.Bin239]|nr:MAG: SprT-like family protein [Tenericutes bacterium ADurb.Bin239]
MFTHTVSINTRNGPINYTLRLTYKRMKTIVFRADEKEANTFNVSLPYGTRLSKLEEVFRQNLKSLKRLQNKAKSVPFTDKTYVFGKDITLLAIKDKYGLKTVPYTLESFYKQTKNILLEYLENSVKKYSKIMGVQAEYKVCVRRMKTRWGTNSNKTMRLTFNEKLIHYHPRIIDALVVHELAHYFVNGHGPKFYKILEKVMPDYKVLDTLLKEHHYEYDNE